jgi:hypothetical protein
MPIKKIFDENIVQLKLSSDTCLRLCNVNQPQQPAACACRGPGAGPAAAAGIYTIFTSRSPGRNAAWV